MTVDLSHYPVVETITEPCTTTQWNFPWARDTPWAADGRCSICDQAVMTTRIGEDDPCLYSHITVPHWRKVTILGVRSDELRALLQYREDC